MWEQGGKHIPITLALKYSLNYSKTVCVKNEKTLIENYFVKSTL